MSYVAAVDHLHALGQELSPSAPRRKFDLEHMRILAAALGDPQKQFPAILIAGTNGKGSTAATLASILAAAGYRTGLYTSPHLSRVTERIRIVDTRTSNLEPRTFSTEIPEDTFARLYFQVDDAARELVSTGQLPHHPSFFESLTALAFLYFADQKLDIAILEVGLGGRLDATNIVEPILSIVTDIALDHQEYLGNTITEIAREKAGILRLNGTLITLPQHPEANQSIGEVAISLNVRGINAADYLPTRAPSINPIIVSESPQSPVILSDPSQSPVILSERSESKDPNRLSPASPLPHLSANQNLSPLTPNHYDLILHNELLKVRSPLAGQHQQRNIALAIAAAVELRNSPPSVVILSGAKNPRILPATPHPDSSNQTSYIPTTLELTTPNLQPLYNIPNSAIEAGIANTAWPGRLEFLPPNLILDVAHNPAGAWTLRAAIATLPEHQPRTLIFSCLRDKDLTEMAQILFPLFDSSSDRPHDHIILVPIDNPRAASLDELLASARALDVPAHTAHHPADALALARSLTPANGLIFATGSIYLIGALRDAAVPPQSGARSLP